MRTLDRRGEKGFTLIELMVVVLIIGILVAIALPTFLGARTRAQDSAAKAQLRTALAASMSYFTDNGSYTGLDAAGVPEGEESSVSWVYPSAAATKGNVTINLASGDVLIMSASSESNASFCLYSNEGPGISLVRGGVDAHGGTLVAPLCVPPSTW